MRNLNLNLRNLKIFFNKDKLQKYAIFPIFVASSQATNAAVPVRLGVQVKKEPTRSELTAAIGTRTL